MALWGDKEGKDGYTGTITIVKGVNGNNTLGTATVTTGGDGPFNTTTEYSGTTGNVGDYLVVVEYSDPPSGTQTVTKYLIVSITTSKIAIVKSVDSGDVIEKTDQSGFYFDESPKFVSESESETTSGDSGDVSKVFGVTVTEMTSGGDNVVSVAIVDGGTQYTEAPVVTFSGGDSDEDADAISFVSGGSVVSVKLTDPDYTGTEYDSPPTVIIATPSITVESAGWNTTTDQITKNGHLLNTGDEVTYVPGSGTQAAGDIVTVDGDTAFNTANTVAAVAHPFVTGDRVTYDKGAGGTTPTSLAEGDYYVVKTGANEFKLATTRENATSVPPVLKTFTKGSATGAAQTFTYKFAAEQLLYVIKVNGNSFKLARTSALATAGTAIDITSAGTTDAGGARKIQLTSGAATAIASLGSGNSDNNVLVGATVTHPGWVRRVVGTGGRAGRIQYETLVASGTISGETDDDIEFPG